MSNQINFTEPHYVAGITSVKLVDSCKKLAESFGEERLNAMLMIHKEERELYGNQHTDPENYEPEDSEDDGYHD
ncbi:hypothetical protein KTD15_06145 [Burkholderia multivorans]|uniref:hypothetical protein n=1 Tax=Burkholderia multivorans TaxID=87883 RepID=UPI001C249B34|nr:hypothetical protein [Burkholderia multivorans]MBU9118374.1 hypothetical protein [Burkholderia multivorans]